MKFLDIIQVERNIFFLYCGSIYLLMPDGIEQKVRMYYLEEGGEFVKIRKKIEF